MAPYLKAKLNFINILIRKLIDKMVLDLEEDAKLMIELQLIPPKPFVYLANRSSGVYWDLWLQDLNVYFDACGIKSDNKRINILFNLAGSHAKEVYKSSIEAKENDDYEAVLVILNAYYRPKRTKIYEEFIFYKMRQGKRESLSHFYNRLKSQASLCCWTGDRLDDQLKLQITRGCRSLKLQESILLNLKDNGTVADIFSLASDIEISKLISTLFLNKQ